MAGVATLFLLVVLTGLLTFRSKKAEEILEGEPILETEGKIAIVPAASPKKRRTPEPE